MNPLIDQSKINFYSRYEIYAKEIWRMIYYLRCVDSAYCTPMSMKSGLIMMNYVFQRWFLSSISPLKNCHLPSGLARAPVRFSLGTLASWPPVRLAGGHLAAWQLSPVGPSSGGHPAAGGGEGVGDSLWWAWPEPRGPGSSAMIQSEPFGVSLDIDIGWILMFH